MRKTSSTQSLLNSCRSSVHKIPFESKSKLEKQKSNPKNQPPSPNIKNSLYQTQKLQKLKTQQTKNDIKEIYEYKIKQKAKQSKIGIEKSRQLQKSNPSQIYGQPFYGLKSSESIKIEHQKTLKQLQEVSKQNKRLKDLIINSQMTKSKKTTDDKFIESKKDYKKQMLNKLNERQRLKTELTSSFAKVSNGVINNISNDKMNYHDTKPKDNMSKNKSREGSRNSITMNLNMSFVKIKSPSSGKNADWNKKSQQKIIQKMSRSNSNKLINTFKQQPNKSYQVSLKQQAPNIKSLLKQISTKKQINLKDLQEFYFLNKKIFSQFNDLLVVSKQTFTQVLNKIKISECYDSKQPGKQNNKMKMILDNIHQLYRVNHAGSINAELYRNNDHSSEFSSGKRYNVSQIELNDHLTPSSSVISFKQLQANPQRQKSYQKYRLKKLNENLDLIANFQNKKLRTQITQPQTTQPKVYFSKPISTHVSRKISFNNSFNNSLKNSKID